MPLQKGFIVSLEDPSFRYSFILNPDGFSDDKGTDYSRTKVPSISHPVYSYSSGTERKINFDLVMVRDLSDPPVPAGIFTKFGKQIISSGMQIFGGNLPFRPNAKDPLASLGGAIGRVPILGDLMQGSRGSPEFEKFDITMDVLAMRSFLYPAAEVSASLKKTAPHKLLFNFGPFYQNVKCVMTACNVQWKMWSPDLIPLMAKLSIDLEEVIDVSVNREDILANRPTPVKKSAGSGSSLSGTLLRTAVGIGAVAAVAVAGGQTPTGAAVVKRFGK